MTGWETKDNPSHSETGFHHGYVSIGQTKTNLARSAIVFGLQVSTKSPPL